MESCLFALLASRQLYTVDMSHRLTYKSDIKTVSLQADVSLCTVSLQKRVFMCKAFATIGCYRRCLLMNCT